MTVQQDRVAARTRSAPLHCPECFGDKTGVIDSAPNDVGCVRRRYLCAECEHRWTTYEVPPNRPDATFEESNRLYWRWLNVHKICDIGERAVRVTA